MKDNFDKNEYIKMVKQIEKEKGYVPAEFLILPFINEFIDNDEASAKISTQNDENGEEWVVVATDNNK